MMKHPSKFEPFSVLNPRKADDRDGYLQAERIG